MQFWDDLTRTHANVTILGATNRPEDLDPAILRRFERSFLVPPPDLSARQEVLRKLLRKTLLDRRFDFAVVAASAEGYTPSDLVAVCRAAVQKQLAEARKANLVEGLERKVAPLQTVVSNLIIFIVVIKSFN